MSTKFPMDKGKSQEPLGELRNIMNEFFHRKPVKGFLQSMDEFFQMPFSTFPVQLKETDEAQIISAELPGVKKEQIAIHILDRSITITVKNVEIITEENEARNLYKRSQSMQQMSRNIFLGFSIDEQRVKASYQNGLLKIKVPKPKSKQITISEE